MNLIVYQTLKAYRGDQCTEKKNKKFQPHFSHSQRKWKKKNTKITQLFHQDIASLITLFIGNPLNFPCSSCKGYEDSFHTLLDHIISAAPSHYHSAKKLGCIHSPSFIEREIRKRYTSSHYDEMSIKWPLLKSHCLKRLDVDGTWLLLSHPQACRLFKEAQRGVPIESVHKLIKNRSMQEGYHKKYKPGLNILFNCTEKCNKTQILHFGYGSFNIFELSFDGLNCPTCNEAAYEIETLVLSNCHYKIVTVKAKDKNQSSMARNSEYLVDEDNLREEEEGENTFYKSLYRGYQYNAMTVYSTELGDCHTSGSITPSFSSPGRCKNFI